MVEVFKTDVHSVHHAELIRESLQLLYPQATISFDLEDCDRILRVELPAKISSLDDIVETVQSYRYRAEPLAD